MPKVTKKVTKSAKLTRKSSFKVEQYCYRRVNVLLKCENGIIGVASAIPFSEGDQVVAATVQMYNDGTLRISLSANLEMFALGPLP
jgi:hypothetical protein